MTGSSSSRRRLPQGSCFILLLPLALAFWMAVMWLIDQGR